VQKFNLRYLYLLFWAFNSFLAVSQSIVHIENKRMLHGDKPFRGNVELGLNLVQNINEIFQTNNNSQLHYYFKKHNLMSLNAFNLNMVNKNRIVSDGFQHFRYGYKITERLTYEAFTQIQYNEIVKIQSRYLNATGGRFKIADKDSIRLFFGSLYMFEREQETTGKLNFHHRLSNYLSFGTRLANNLHLDLMTYYQPDMANFSDFRFSGEGILEMQFNKRLGFRIISSWFYDSSPPEGIRRTFYTFRNSLKYSF
jgi:hypothetical protein